MNVELVTIGTELLLGQIVDTNATWIAQRLAEAGINLFYKTTVGDNRQRVAGVIRHALNRADVVLTTGGLGPTVDDITREAIADATERDLVVSEELIAHIRSIFHRWGGREPGENNLRQARIPAGATVLSNPVGTAPGFRVEYEGKHVIAMPGVPREMKRMMNEQVLPFLRTQAREKAIIKVRVLRTISIGESSVDERIADLMVSANPTIGLAAHTGQVDVRITARAPGEREANIMIEQLERKVRRRLEEYIYGVDDETIELVIGRLLAERGETLALHETNTEGRLAERFEAVAPEVVVAASVGEPAPPAAADVEAAAARLRGETGATWVLVIQGTAGADEGTYGERSGETMVALAGPTGVERRALGIGGRDDHTLGWIGNRALDMVHRAI